jgi:hypothetical protein
MKTMNKLKDMPDVLFAGAEQSLLSREELQRRYGPLIDRGVEAIEACFGAKPVPRPVFTLASVKIWFADTMQMIDNGVGALANAFMPPSAQPALAMLGVGTKGTGGTRGGKDGAKGEEAAQDGKTSPLAKYSAIQKGQGCIGRLDVSADPEDKERLRLVLTFLSLEEVPQSPFFVTIRDKTGRARFDRDKCASLTFVVPRVRPMPLSFRLEDETGDRWVEFEMGAEPIR